MQDLSLLDSSVKGFVQNYLEKGDHISLVDKLIERVAYYESLFEYHGNILLTYDIDNVHGGYYEEILCKSIAEVNEMLQQDSTIGFPDDDYRALCREALATSDKFQEFIKGDARIKVSLITEWD